jgi:hypothetical protein
VVVAASTVVLVVVVVVVIVAAFLAWYVRPDGDGDAAVGTSFRTVWVTRIPKPLRRLCGVVIPAATATPTR